MARKIRIGIVGLGGIYRWGHLPALQKHPEVEIAAVCDILPDRAAQAAKELNIKRFCTDYRDLLKLNGLDAVDICTPNLFHSEIAIAGLKRGLHVFTEKPDAISASEAQKMADAARKSGKILMAMRNNRVAPWAKFMKDFVDQGNMGEIYTGRCGWIRRRGIPGKGGWFTTKALSGGGPLIDLGVHFIDVTMWLMGNPKPVAVSGATYRKFADAAAPADSIHASFGEAKDEGTFDVEDLATGFIRFANGATLQIEFSWASNIEEEATFFELRGTRAGAKMYNGNLSIFSELNGQLTDTTPRFGNSQDGNHARFLAHFIDCLQGRAKPIMDPAQGVAMIKILTAIYESAKTGAEVRL